MKQLTLILAFFVLNCYSAAAQKSQASDYDIVILGGRVIDPETSLDAIKNVGIINGKIETITDEKISGKKAIHADGMVVSPGFIDLHSHGQSVVADRMQAFDGVTTALELESGILPISDWYETQSTIPRVLNYGASAGFTFARISEMEGLKMEADLRWFQKAFALNKWVNDPAGPEQVERIVDRIEQGIKDGSIGIGVNHGYAPGAGYKEILAVHTLAAKYGVPVFTHVSGDFPNDPKSAAESVGWIISYAAAVGSQEHICHLNSSSLKDSETTTKMVLGAQKRGLPITTEAYTYGASSTTIGAALFNEEALVQKNIKFSQIEINGKPLDEKTFYETRKNAPGTIVVFKFLEMPKEEDILDRTVLFPGGAIASDGMPWIGKNGENIPDNDTQWPLSKDLFAHPRSAGTYTKLLAHYVRDRKVLTLSEAIEKSSLIPAQILEKSVEQMKFKGRIQKGMDADILVFDPNTVQDRATFTEPNQTAVGMKYVFVNGTMIIDNGELVTDAHPGKPIRREITK
ncbi:amidohydrolase family protein [Aequorivita todarodis]|uniref:amidohydrolase family protein n=1 Tax=Aequorivita todarodis TaxID=2036821 RepID=UPI002350EBB2|nr:amidohydrolase family protein [Aequorivita todarodis]MDC8001182.1 amidohydrolase family protein [Aequorivita todarodis]